MAKTAFGQPLPIPLHRNARLRQWLGEKVAGDAAMGDLVWRRIVHMSGALVLLYFVFPGDFWVTPWPQTTTVILLLLLEAGLFIELFRHLGYVDVPVIRPYERDRIAGYCWYAMGLTFAVLLFPEPVAVAVVLGAAFVDPLIGEFRRRGVPRAYSGLAFGAYALMAGGSLYALGGWAALPAVVGALVAAAVALAVERLRAPFVDDDFTMPVVPGLVLLLVAMLWPGGVGG
jgi:hypothetical protein